MARVESKMIPLKTALKHFVLFDPEDRRFDSKELMGKTGL